LVFSRLTGLFELRGRCRPRSVRIAPPAYRSPFAIGARAQAFRLAGRVGSCRGLRNRAGFLGRIAFLARLFLQHGAVIYAAIIRFDMAKPAGRLGQGFGLGRGGW
jgi:hypothetical protein